MITSRTAVVDGPAGPPQSQERTRGDGPAAPSGDLALLFVTVAATVPIIVAAVRAAARGWLPVADDAFIAIRARDVIEGPRPLVGLYSSASRWAERLLHHPGPLQFDVAAIPVRLFGPGWGTALATAGVNVVAIVVVALLARRLLGARTATVVILFIATLAWSLGSETLFDPWNEHATVFPFLAFLFAAWAAGSGLGFALPVLAFTGSYCLQTHLSYAVLVPVVTVCACVTFALSVRRKRRELAGGDPAGDRGRRDLRWAAAGLATLVVCWLQPLYQQVTGHPGNLTELFHAAGTKPLHPPGPKGALQAVGGVVGIPPFWLPPTWKSPPFRLDGTGRPLALLALSLVAMVAAGIFLGLASRRRGDRTTVIGLVTAGVTVAAAMASTARSTSPYGLVATYVRWLWPISMFTWAVLVVAGFRVVLGRPRARLDHRVRTGATVGVSALVLAVALLTLPTVDHGTGTRPWGMPVTRELARQALPRLAGRGTVLVRLPASEAAFVVGPAILFELQQHGINFVTDDESIVASVGTSRRFTGANAKVAVTVLGGAAADRPRHPGQRIAYVPALDRTEKRELSQLRRRVADRFRALGQDVPVDEGKLDRLPLLERRSANSLVRRAGTGDLLALAELARNHQIRLDRFPGINLSRWADLTGRQVTEGTALMLTTVRPS